MIAEEKPMNLKLDSDSESSDSSDIQESDNEMEESGSEPEEANNEDELPEKFDLTKINQRLEEAPASSSDDEDNDEETDQDESDEDDEDKGSGWADAMAKVLNIGKNTESNKPLLLSKAKKDRKEVIAEEDNKPREKASVRRQKKKELAEKGRTRPDIVKDRMKEKRLVRTATRGVVQLFNAVREQQKTLKTQLNKAGLSVTKRDKVYKNLDKDAFLQVLQSKKTRSNDPPPPTNLKIKAEDDDGTWSVLKDNFMMGAKMKDWDKDSDDQGCD